MHIIFAVQGLGVGGAERVISILSNEFVKKGNKVTIAMIGPQMSTSAYYLHESIDCDWIESKSYSSLKTINNLNHRLKEYFASKRPDIVISFIHVVCAKCIIPCRALGIPLIYSERNDPSHFIQGLASRVFQWYLVKHTKYFVFQTNGAKNLYPKRLHKNSIVISNPVDYSSFPPYFEGQRRKEIVTVGRLSKQKNQQLLIKAFYSISQKFPDYVLKIYGEGSLRGELETLIYNLKMTNRVLLMGTENNILQKINDASLFVFTSDYEGSPNALIEAMVLGLPCISTKCSPGGAEEIIDDNINGILVDCNNCDELAEKMEYLLANDSIALKMGKNATKIITRIQADNIANKWEIFIKGVIHNEHID